MKKRVGLALLVLLTVIFSFGCSSKANIDNNQQVNDGGINTGNTNAKEVNYAANEGRKLIREAAVSVETKQYENFCDNLTGEIKNIGGYIETSNIQGKNNKSDFMRYATITARVPNDKLDAFLSKVSEIGNVINRTESAKDVTLEYVDAESWLKSLKTEEESLLKLLENATNLQEIMEIQTKLTELRQKVESYESTIRKYDNLIDFAKVQINISEVERETEKEADNIWSRIGNNLEDGFVFVWNFLVGLFVFVISAIPYLIIPAIIGSVVYYFVKKNKKKKQDYLKNLGIDKK